MQKLRYFWHKYKKCIFSTFSGSYKFSISYRGPWYLHKVSEKKIGCTWGALHTSLSRDMVVLSKTVLLSFHPKQANKLTGVHMASRFWLFIAFLTWPNLTCSNRPLSLFFHPLTFPGYLFFCCLLSENKKIEIKMSGVQLLNFSLIA